MGSVVKFAAVNTKVKVLEGKFFSKEQYLRLIEKNTYEDAIKYLKEETGYSSVLSSYNIDEIHRGQLEIILKKNYIKNFYKVMHYFNGNYKKLLNILFMRYVIEDLKVIIRCKYIGKKSEDIYPLLAAEGSLNHLNYKKLAEAKDLQDFVQQLNGTEFYNVLQPLVGKASEEGLFRIETALDSVYFASLRRYKGKVEFEDKKILSDINGTYCDLLNIQWIIRGKNYYNLSPEVLFNYVIGDGLKLRKEELKKLCYAKDQNEVLELIDGLPYRKVFNETAISSEVIERNILAYLRKYFNSYKKQNKMNLALVMSYLELSYLELRDIISIVENIRYSAEHEEIKKFVTFAI